MSDTTTQDTKRHASGSSSLAESSSATPIPVILSATEKEGLLQDKDAVKAKIEDDDLFARLMEIIEKAQVTVDALIAACDSPDEEERDTKRQAIGNRDDHMLDDQILEPQVFLDALIDVISISDWEYTTIIVRPLFSMAGFEYTKIGAKALVKKELASCSKKIERFVVTTTSPGKNYRTIIYEPSEFLRSKINTDWICSEDVSEFLKRTHSIVRRVDGRDDIDVVQRTPDTPLREILMRCRDEKARAIVVAGESGSGKSFFSCVAPPTVGFQVLYCVMRSADFRGPCPTQEFPEWHGFILKVKEVMDNVVNGSKINQRLHDAKSRLSSSRNEWANRAAARALKRTVDSHYDDKSQDVDSWFEGNLVKEKRPKNLAIVLDESTDPSFAFGMVDSVREFHRVYEQRLVSESIQLFLVGTGLDLIAFEKLGGRVGTDPKKSIVIVMKQPKIDQAFGVTGLDRDASPSTENQAISNAIYTGSISRILATNARMLFDGVLYVMRKDVFSLEAPGQDNIYPRLQERLSLVGSFRSIMGYAVQFYVGCNRLGDMGKGESTELMDECFVYHLHAAGSEAGRGDGDNAMLRCLRSELEIVEDFNCTKRLLSDDSERVKIFQLGLACRSGTSPALKYLACFGLSEHLGPFFAGTLEAVTKLHIARYAEVQGFAPIVKQLKHGWPPKPSLEDENIIKTIMIELEETLGKQCEKQEVNLKAALGDGNRCYILWQGTPTTQGADVFALFVEDGGKAWLDCIQCRHVKDYPGDSEAKRWWKSLGYNFQEENTGDCPSLGSAGGSYTGLQVLRKCLQELLEVDVTLGRRILATSLPASALGSLPIPKDGVVWCRELLEPTISVCDPPLPKEED